MAGGDGFQGLLAELAQIEVRAVASAEGQPEPGNNHKTARLATQLLSELLNTAPLITVATAIANAVEAGHPRLHRRAIAVYAPVQTPSFQKLVERLLDTETSLDICAAVQNHCARLSLAVRSIFAGVNFDDLCRFVGRRLLQGVLDVVARINVIAILRRGDGGAKL